jgi:hypothetical protein
MVGEKRKSLSINWSTKKRLLKIAGELQMKEGEEYSLDKTINHLIDSYSGEESSK